MSDDYLHFQAVIKKKTGIDLSLYKEKQMKRRLTSLYQKLGFRNFDEYLSGVLSDKEMLADFLDRMTINYSEFYRNPARWQMLEEKILPSLYSQKSKLKVWSAACSTGEEPYTLAMTLSNFKPLSEISVLATDLDQNVLERAKIGAYTEGVVQPIPERMKLKYLYRDGSLYKVNDEIKQAVTFRKQNLLADSFQRGFDLIVCRNVMIYFTDEAKKVLYEKFSSALNPGGILFVGNSEQLFTPEQYGLESEGAFFYKKK